jgi:ABC-type amino acid transport substrate-binding protein
MNLQNSQFKIIPIIYFFLMLSIHLSAQSAVINLTSEESEWLIEHPVIRVSNSLDWPPFDFAVGGVPQGYSIDVLNLVSQRIGIEIEYVNGYSWPELLDLFKQGDIDLLHSVSKSAEREKFALFSNTVTQHKSYFVIHEDKSEINKTEQLKDKKVAVLEGYHSTSFIEANYPDLQLYYVTNTEEALFAISAGTADVAIINDDVARFVMRQKRIGDVKVSGWFREYDQNLNSDLHYMVQKDSPELQGMLNKALSSLLPSELEIIEKKWFGEELVSETDVSSRGFLTAEEQQWLNEHPVIRVHNESEWRPFNFNVDGEPQGYSIDIFDLLAEKTGFKVEYISGKSWGDYIGMIQNGDLDVMLNIARSEEREEFLLFTDSYLAIAPVAYSRVEESPISSIEDLFGKRFAIPEGFFLERVLKEYPEIEIIPLYDTRACILAVSSGQADFLFDMAPTVNYYTKVSLIDNLKIAGAMGIDAENPVDLRIGVRDDWSILHAILQKGLSAISDNEFDALNEEWLGVSKSDDLGLTQLEKAFLISHPVITVHNEKNWPPFNFNKSGIPQGLSIDYMNLLADKIGIEINYITGPTWNEFLQMIKAKELDVMLNIVKTKDRQEYILFTDFYIKNPNVIISDSDNSYNTIESLQGKTIAIPEGFFYQEIFERDYPEIKLLLVEDVLESLRAVQLKKADAAFGEEAVFRYLISENFLTGLQLSGEVNIGNDELPKLNIGIRNDWPELESIFRKAMTAVTGREMNEIRQKWDSTTVTGGARQISKNVNEDQISGYLIVLITAAVFLFLGAGFWLIIKVTKKKNIAVHFGSKWFRWFTLAGLGFIITIVIILGLVLLNRDKRKIVSATEGHLIITMENAEARLNLWYKQGISYIENLGQEIYLVHLVNKLLEVNPDHEILLSSPELEAVRLYFAAKKKNFPNIGFFIINSDYISIGSSRDKNIGTPNIIAQEYPELIDLAFSGESLFIPAMESDVSLSEVTGSEGTENPPTMFFLGPVRQADGSVIAVVALRVDPTGEFSQALQFSKAQASSDTYAISNKGLLLSESRFDDSLREIGMIGKDQISALNMEIRDPGVNLLKGRQPFIELSEQPLTSMAEAVVWLSSSAEVSMESHSHSAIVTVMQGYRDYRGVFVFGSGL